MDVAAGVAEAEVGGAVGAAVQDLVGAEIAAEEVVDSVVADVAQAEWAEEASPETLAPLAVSAAVLVEQESAELVLQEQVAAEPGLAEQVLEERVAALRAAISHKVVLTDLVATSLEVF